MKMNNKQLGTEFENEMVEILSKDGWWAHFISPNASGAQPFDIIAVKAGHALAIDCKTCERNTFTIDRLEDNQILAFELWLKCGNEEPMVAVKHKGGLFMIPYKTLRAERNIKLTEKYFKKLLT